MRKNILNSLAGLAIVIAFAACKPRKDVIVPPPVEVKTEDKTVEPVPDKKMETVQMLRDKNVSFNTLSLTGKAHLDIDGQENNVSITIKIKQNEMIWVSIGAIIGEVARVAITPDSIKIINRLQTTYTQKPFSYIHEFTSKKIDFSVLQAVLSGNLFTQLLTDDVKVEQPGGVWQLSGNNEELAYRFLFNTLLRVQETNLNDPAAGQALKIVYGDYQQLNGALYPSSIDINSMSGVKKMNISLNFSSIKGNVPLDFPFSVKSRFKIIN